MIQKFSEDIIQKVWEKGQIVSGNNPLNRRKDSCGAWISKNLHGDRTSKTNEGWEIDHINPDGDNSLVNLRPLQWYNNVDKSDGRLNCPIKAKQ